VKPARTRQRGTCFAESESAKPGMGQGDLLHDLKHFNRPVRTRMPGGVGGVRRKPPPIPIIRIHGTDDRGARGLSMGGASRRSERLSGWTPKASTTLLLNGLLRESISLYCLFSFLCFAFPTYPLPTAYDIRVCDSPGSWQEMNDGKLYTSPIDRRISK
jgi:hypothetical protein